MNISLHSSISYLKGRSKFDDMESPLAHIPPLYGKLVLDYEQERWGVSFDWRFNGRKELEDYAPGSSDNEEYATAEGSLAWQTFNLYANYDISDKLTFRLGMENLADIHYRPFSSGVSAPGRNLKIGVYGSF